MKKFFFMAAALLCALNLSAQKADDRDTEKVAAPEIVWTSADIFPVYGKCIENTSARYGRLPAEYKGVSRDAVWYLGRNSAGLYVRFRSNSPSINVRWTSTFKNLMNHQTPTGTRGLDLYTLYKGEWRFAGSGRPDVNEWTTTQKIIGNMDGSMREYMLYLSLYDGVSELSIGVEEGSVLEQPAVDRPSSKRPVVMYGTSILQGGCANRPGMTHTAIIGRLLDREVINLGFSGNALLDMEIARLMAQVEDPAVYVMDYAPNAWDYLIREKGEEFFRIVRDAHPDVPVIFIEDVIFPHTIFDPVILAEVTKKNVAQRELFEKLKKQGEKRIYYIKAEGMIGDDGEATVDGYHFTDLGMMRYVDYVLPVIKKAIRRAGK
ncbi:MAG: SGNH/GDSL hydrolase family protein [Bacteroidales bacterium]|nr:SGNH/GDSL hydrolase family protein [Bacteroidales bacterium]